MTLQNDFIPPNSWLELNPVHNYLADDLPPLSGRLETIFIRLQRQIENALPAALFDKDGDGPVTLWKGEALECHLKDWREADACRENVDANQPASKDRAGIYVFAACVPNNGGNQPFYVGISRNLCTRLRQHLRGKSHNDSSLLYAMIRGEPVSEAGVRKSRKDVSMTDHYADNVRAWLKSQRVALLPIACPVERYLLELYAAIRLQTGKWNAFETH